MRLYPTASMTNAPPISHSGLIRILMAVVLLRQLYGQKVAGLIVNRQPYAALRLVNSDLEPDSLRRQIEPMFIAQPAAFGPRGHRIVAVLRLPISLCDDGSGLIERMDEYGVVHRGH